MSVEGDLESWTGRTTIRKDSVSRRLADQFKAALVGLVEARPVPLGLFWALCPDIANADQLGRDGHPRTGIFMPPLPLPRRMWAGGELVIHAEFEREDEVEKHATIEKIAFKKGSTGDLGFVTLRNTYLARGRVVIEERQDIVYREEPRPGVAAAPVPPAAYLGEPIAKLEIATDPVLLFRYSALTFNGHRIHYDQPYAIGIEHYGGLVVHGPLQATILMNLAMRAFGGLPSRFSYRGVSPLVCGQPAIAEAHRDGDGKFGLRVRVAEGPVTMTATAEG
jgi:3-methylfumaryl-CoA hydratase